MPQQEHWATRIRLQLPSLGEVQARLSLSGQQLVMHVVAPESSSVLSQHAETLRGRYAAQGMQLSQLSIQATDMSQAIAASSSLVPDTDIGPVAQHQADTP